MAYTHMNITMMVIVLYILMFFVLVHASPISLMLKRIYPNNGMNLSHLRTMDIQRIDKMLQSNTVNLPLYGSSDPLVVGFYYTTVYLGTPPKKFHVAIDTGSDVPWVNCVSCIGCPQISDLKIKLNYFDPWSSLTSSVIPCSHNCAICSTNNQCSYKLQYEDGSGTSGYLVSDLMHVANISKGPTTPNSSVPLVFGCSNMRTEILKTNKRALDGIFGFGKGDTSLISQLNSQGKAPRAFSHCLKGDTNGGGILVLGEVVEPKMSYTPLIPNKTHYNVNLESISINGHILQIDPTTFITSSNKGASFDSGTTLAYFTEEAYNSIVDAIKRTIPQFISITSSDGFICYFITTSVLNANHIFPSISLNFANNASLVLKPEDYLIQFPIFYEELWCLGFQKSQDVTILGEIILKNKIIVYDLDRQQIGWTNYNCSLPVNVSIPSNGNNTSEKGGTSLCDRPIMLKMLLVLMIYMTMILL